MPLETEIVRQKSGASPLMPTRGRESILMVISWQGCNKIVPVEVFLTDTMGIFGITTLFFLTVKTTHAGTTSVCFVGTKKYCTKSERRNARMKRLRSLSLSIKENLKRWWGFYWIRIFWFLRLANEACKKHNVFLKFCNTICIGIVENRSFLWYKNYVIRYGSDFFGKIS